MKKKNRVICMILVLCLALSFLAGCRKKMSVQDYLDLGDKYLTEANYEQAIIAFTKAIELEPKAMKAYEGLADAYVKTEEYEKAKETIQSGIAVYEGLAEAEQTEELWIIYEALLRTQEELEVSAAPGADVPSEAEETQDPAMQKQEELIREAQENYGPLLEQIIEVMDRGTLEFDYYYTSDFEDFIDKLDQPLIWQLEDERYLGIYECGHIYLGEMENGIRSGMGAWYYDDPGEEPGEETSELYVGSWSEDYPNGSGVYSQAYGSGDFYERWSAEGGFLDGYEHGTMRLSIETHAAGEVDSEITEYQITRGVPDGLMQGDDGLLYQATIIKPNKSEAFLHEKYVYMGYEEGDVFAVNCAEKE